MREYFLGLQNQIELKADDNNFEYSIIKSNGNKVIFKGSISQMSVIVVEEYIDNKKFNKMCEIVKGEEKDISEEGDRWEGDWFNGEPFGCGSFFDSEGNRMYTGFVFEGKKVGFGTEYFTDSHMIDYCGNFVNDLRHGFGTSYDKKGNLLYEGDWRRGNNSFEEENVFVEDNCEEDFIVHDFSKELVIGENCCNTWKGDLKIRDYPLLERIIVKKYSFNNINKLWICGNEQLRCIDIQDGDIEIQNNLYQAKYRGSFDNVEKLIIRSNVHIILY